MKDSGHQPVTKPTRYCRKCWYALDGLTENRCPECGRKFDPDNKRTYRTRPRASWWLRTLGRTAAILLILLAIFAGWLYRIHYVNQQAMAWVTTQGGSYNTEPLGPPWLTDRLIDYDLPVIETVVVVDLEGTSITDAGLVRLSQLTRLQALDLRRTSITDTGLAHLSQLTSLQYLYLQDTSITDAGLAHLSQLTSLQDLDLDDTSITDAGVAELRKALPQTQIDR